MDPNSPHPCDPRERGDSGPVITGGTGRKLAAPSLPAIFVTTLTVKCRKSENAGAKDWGFTILGSRPKATCLIQWFPLFRE